VDAGFGPSRLRTRVSEALSLERADVDLDGLALRVMGKGRKVRLVPISAELRKHLVRFLDRTDGRYVFHTFGGSRLERHNVYENLQRLCSRIGITCRANLHNFRHAFAAHSMKNGLDVFRLSRILGHTNIATTQIYSTYVVSASNIYKSVMRDVRRYRQGRSLTTGVTARAYVRAVTPPLAPGDLLRCPRPGVQKVTAHKFRFR